MRVKNLNVVVEALKLKLRDYLEEHGTQFSRTHFTCPNRRMHKNGDNKPSCGFYPDDQHFHCFTCNSSGDIFNAASYLEGMSIEGPEFIDAVVELAKRYEIPVEVEEDVMDAENRKLHKMLELIRDVCHKTYQSTEAAKNYVAARKLTEVEEIAKFGYCNYDKLKGFLASKGYDEKDLEQAGLFNLLMNERLLIPIYNEHNKLVAFCSRRIAEDSTERYYNSSTCQIYKKQLVLYNLNIAKQYETVMIVEGHMNVLTLLKHKVNNVVALGGTSISEDHIRQLVKYGVKRVVLCLDSDDAGKQAQKELIKLLTPITEITTTLIELVDAKDPDEFINKFGIEKFNELKVKNVFDFKLERYISSSGDKDLKEDLLEYIASEPSFMEKEQMCKKLAKAANVRQETAFNEVEIIEKKKLGDCEVTTSDIVSETGALLKEVLMFENWAWSRGKLLGLNVAQYPIMTEKLDGIQNKLYVIAAEENTGKSALAGSLMLNLAISNPRDCFVLYFGLDVDNKTLVARMGSSLSGLPINTFSNPKYKITENEGCYNKDELLKKREDAINILRGLSDSLAIKDEKTVRSVEDMERMIKLYQRKYPEKQLVIFVDSLNQMHTNVKKETRDIYMYISGKLKEWTIKFDVPVIAISELRKLNHPGARPTNDDIKEVSDLKYDADATILIYNELHSRRETTERTFTGPNNMIYPIVELIFFKNKTSGFKGNFYYKFYTDIGKFEECTLDEMRRYWNQ